MLIVGLLLISNLNVVVLVVNKLLGWVIGISFKFMLLGVNILFDGVLRVINVFMWWEFCIMWRFFVFLGMVVVNFFGLYFLLWFGYILCLFFLFC